MYMAPGMLARIGITALLLTALGAFGAEPDKDGARAPLTLPPAGAGADEALEPEVTITERDQGKVQEYRVHGQLYMVKIIPDVGAPYYLIDSDGDGLLEVAPNDLEPKTMMPRWILFQWKR